MKKRWVLLAAVLIFVLTCLGILLNMDPDASFIEEVDQTSERTATIVLIDGLSQSIFLEEIQKGHLPTLQKLLNSSQYIPNGISSFPSMTGYGFFPFITGIDAAESGIFGLRWFDRTRDLGPFRNYVGRTNVHMNYDINPEIKTLFEKYPREYSVSLNSYMNRGVRHNLKTSWAHTTAKFQQSFPFSLLRKVPHIGKKISKNHFQHETLVTDLALRTLQRNPKVQWITYAAPDAHCHIHGIDTIYRKLLHHIDGQLDRLIKAINNYNQTDRLLAIVTDHGVAPVDKNMDVPDHLEDWGIRVTREKSTHLWSSALKKEMADYDTYDAVFVINGNLSAFLYLSSLNVSGSAKWKKRPTAQSLTKYGSHPINLPDSLAQIEGMEFVSYAVDDETIRIANSDEYAKIHRDEKGRYAYIKMRGDPLRYDNLFKPGIYYSENEILSLTYDQNYPYALVRLHKILTDPQGPDMLLTSESGYDLARDYEPIVHNYRAGHGGLHRDQLTVPYILSIPNEEPDTIPYMMSEQVGQVIKSYLQAE